MEKIFIKPAPVSASTKRRAKRELRLVRDPITLKPLSDDGEEKPADSYWLRRVRSGDVVVVEKRPAPATPTPKADTKKKDGDR